MKRSDGVSALPYGEQAKKHKKAKISRTGWLVPRSRNKKRMHARAPVRDSQRTYRVPLMRAHLLSENSRLVKGNLPYSGPIHAREPKATNERADDAEDDSTDLLPAPRPPTFAAVVNLTNLSDDESDTQTGADDEESNTLSGEKDDGTNLLTRTPASTRASAAVIDLANSSGDESDALVDERERATYIREDEETEAAYVYSHNEVRAASCRGSKEESVASSSDDEEETTDARKDTELLDGEVAWPDDVVRIATTENSEGISHPDNGATDWCDCFQQCFMDQCPNALTALYCTPRNCRIGPDCWNRLRDVSGLKLSRTRHGIGVIATHFISEGSIVGEYSGVLTTHDYEGDTGRTSDYAIALESRSTSDLKVYIEARDRGGITRFINYACDVDCLFFEVRYRSQRGIIVVAVRDIQAGSEVTVDYGEIWFHCTCGSIDSRQGLVVE